MKSTGDQKQEFNTTLFLALALAALLAVGLLGLFYGCMENNQQSGNKPHAKLMHSPFNFFRALRG